MPRKKGEGPQRGSKGNYYVPMPLDMAVIERLPDEGAMLGWNPLAYTAKTLASDLNQGLPREQWLKISELTGRLTSMRSAGLLIHTALLGGVDKMGWQRTAKGKQMYQQVTGRPVPSPAELKNERHHDLRHVGQEVRQEANGGGEE